MAREGAQTFSSDQPGCFLCSPEPEWTWLESDHFRAVLGLGPIGRGFTLIAARAHVPSMLDLDSDTATELEAFTADVRGRLGALFGESSVAEHGRVAPCVAPHLQRHQPHCLHAHRLMFPGQPVLTMLGTLPTLRAEEYLDFRAARSSFQEPGQYVYVEDASGRCEIAPVSGPLPRQFLRYIAASQLGRPELADWRARPGLDEVELARRELMPLRR